MRKGKRVVVCEIQRLIFPYALSISPGRWCLTTKGVTKNNLKVRLLLNQGRKD